jgi:hypothetical protein
MLATCPIRTVELIEALRAVNEHCRPDNWDEPDSLFPEAAEASQRAWRALDAAIAGLVAA